MTKIAIMGHGVVGSGVAEVIIQNHENISARAGQDLEIKYILDLRDFDNLSYSDKFIKDFNLIANDDEISIVAEVMGGIEPAYTYVKTCLLNGKSVVTSNKELVAAKGAELLQIARDKGVNFFFEASVGGGIPIIRPMHSCLAANKITEIAGILNGTTNFILTKMIREKMDFSAALKMAQELGYAERNPDADVLGHDACRKICILASLAFGRHIYPDSVYTQGITEITLNDVEAAGKLGYVIKLIGRAKEEDARVSIMVSPALVSKDSQLSSIDDVFNGILVRGNAIGDVVFYGRGAGKLPTASAVVADIIDAAKATANDRSLFWTDCGADFVEPVERVSSAFMLRLKGSVDEYKSAVANTSTILLGHNDEFTVITDVMTEKDISVVEEKLAKLNISVLSKIRVLDY